MKRLPNSWYNRFDIIEKLGVGGNAKVYHVKEKTTNKEFALKELHQKSAEKKARFIDEVNIAKEYSPIISGIIPIFVSCVDEHWYTMPIAIKIKDYLKDKSIEDIVSGAIQLSETLVQLHKRGISHRDIKPSNIYLYENRFCLGDFGLVDFPDNPNDFTRSDRGLGAIFTIAPEMKRDPKHADGKKADVFSFAKTLWMFLSGDEKGFDGVYNYNDPSHSLRYIDNYKDTHLVELEELLKESTDNNPDLRPTIISFKNRLVKWLDIYSDFDKSQASDWNFLSKQLFGTYPPESASWKDTDQIIKIINIVGKTPAYNHMIYSSSGGLDFEYAKSANEASCIEIYAGGFCHIVKPKMLSFAGFGENYRWNYFLFELDKLEPIFNENDLDNEMLAEDIPAHYVSAKYAAYGVYDYDEGIPFSEGYRVVYRYIRGKFLIVMSRGPYNRINGTYDGRHGLCGNLAFRDYIEKLICSYNNIYLIAKQDEKLKNLSDDEIEHRILNLEQFNMNPFINDTASSSSNNAEEIKEVFAEKERSKQYIKENYSDLCFKALFSTNNTVQTKIKFYFQFIEPGKEVLFSFIRDHIKCICNDGYIKKITSPSDSKCYFTYDRKEAITLKNKFNEAINYYLEQKDLLPFDDYKNTISIKLIRCGKPTHLFTKEEIEAEMRSADDRFHNQLVIDEEGYAKVIKYEGYGYLFPVSHESWNAGNVYVGKYSNLSTLNDDYISSLQGWLLYLKTGRKQYMDYLHDNKNEENLINEIKAYY